MTRTKSPSGASTTTTTTRSPPSPVPLGLTPVRLAVVPEWDEYEDAASGRKFFYNAQTKEKTWKPPRKPRTSADGKISLMLGRRLRYLTTQPEIPQSWYINL